MRLAFSFKKRCQPLAGRVIPEKKDAGGFSAKRQHRNDCSKWATNHVFCPVCCATLTGAAYPRSRGGTWAPWWPGRSMHGLSPLARGNLNGGGYWVKSVGPIPARAGEPIQVFKHAMCG